MPTQKVDADIIIVRTLRLFKERGYQATSMADIGGACGLLKGSIYHHFPSKQALALAVMDHVQNYFTEHVFHHAYAVDASPQRKLKLLIKASETYFLGSKGGCLMGNLALETVDVLPQFGKAIKRYFDDWTNALAHILKSKYPPKEAQRLAKQAVAEIQGAIMLMRVYKTSECFLLANRRLLDRVAG
jgi:TetR/AcrR family transcriptional regulator, lmrAB and yxaGH operons repressor